MSSSEVTSGSVKWFNKKTGYGFITPKDGGTDVFVHHTGLVVSGDHSKYLSEGEYVQYTTEPVEGDESKIRAVNVKGMNGGPLVCETRRQSRPNRVSQNGRYAGRPRQYSRDASCPAGNSSNPCGWKLVVDGETTEEKVFEDGDGVRWRFVKDESNASASD